MVYTVWRTSEDAGCGQLVKYPLTGVAMQGGAKEAFTPPPFFPERQEFYLYLNDLLPQIVDLVVLILGKYHNIKVVIKPF